MSTPDLDKEYLTSSWPLEVISTTIAIPTLIVLLLLGLKYYDKGFADPFHKIIFVCIFNDVVLYYAQMFIMRWPQMGIFGFYKGISHSFLPAVFTHILLAIVTFQSLLTLLIAVNRLHSLFIPLTHAKFWREYHNKLLLILFVISQPISLYIASAGAIYNQFARDAFFIHTNGMKGFGGVSLFVVVIVITVLTTICNIASALKIFEYQRAKIISSKGINISFHLYSFATFILQFIFMFTELGIHIFPTNSFLAMFCMTTCNIATDILCLSSLWMWLLMSRETRDLLWKKEKKGSIIDVATWSSQR